MVWPGGWRYCGLWWSSLICSLLSSCIWTVSSGKDVLSASGKTCTSSDGKKNCAWNKRFHFPSKNTVQRRKRERKRKESEITVIATHFIPWQSRKIQTRFLSLFQVQKFPSKIVLKKKKFLCRTKRIVATISPPFKLNTGRTSRNRCL